MKRRTLLAGASALALSACVPTTTIVMARPDGRPDATPPAADLEPFYEPLEPHGDWWWSEQWGWVWSPTVGAGWRPYTRGTWVWTTDSGWLWTSSEPFGWAVFHYGRWVWLDDAGWVWVPGRVWGPAWVVWRQGPGFVGWAPMHPDVAWIPGRGFVDVDLERGVVPGAWVFVDDRSVVAPNVAVVCWPVPRNVVVLRRSHVIIHQGHPPGHEHRNEGVDVDVVSHASGTPVRPHKVIHTEDTRAAPASHDSDDVVVPRPRAVARPRPDEPDLYGKSGRLQRDVEERTLPAPADDDVDRHWEDVRRRVVRDQEVERQTPPRDVTPDDLQRRQRQEMDELEREKEEEKKAAKKKKTTTRKVTARPRPR